MTERLRAVPPAALLSLAGALLMGCVTSNGSRAGGDDRSVSQIQEINLFSAPVALNFDGVPGADGVSLRVYVGNPEEVSVLELADRLLAISGSGAGTTFVPGRPGDPQQRCPDISRMIERYGWRPRVALDDGLRLTVGWLDETRALRASAEGGM